MPAAVRDTDPEPAPWLLTLRLALHEITSYHANELYELDSDPRVMRYIGNGRASTREQIDDAMRRLPRAYALYPGLGTWRATRRAAICRATWRLPLRCLPTSRQRMLRADATPYDIPIM